MNSVYLKNDIVEINVVGDQTQTSVAAMGEQAQALLDKQVADGKPPLVLDNITKLGATDIPARKTVADLAHTLPYKRLAMLGDGSVIMRVATNLLLRAVGKGARIKYFEDYDEAVAWLLSGK